MQKLGEELDPLWDIQEEIWSPHHTWLESELDDVVCSVVRGPLVDTVLPIALMVRDGLFGSFRQMGVL